MYSLTGPSINEVTLWGEGWFTLWRCRKIVWRHTCSKARSSTVHNTQSLFKTNRNTLENNFYLVLHDLQFRQTICCEERYCFVNIVTNLFKGKILRCVWSFSEGIEVSDIISKGDWGYCDEMWQKGRGQSCDVIYGRPPGQPVTGCTYFASSNDIGQIVHTCTSVTEHYNLLPVIRAAMLFAMRLGRRPTDLTSYWPWYQPTVCRPLNLTWKSKTHLIFTFLIKRWPRLLHWWSSSLLISRLRHICRSLTGLLANRRVSDYRLH